MSEAVYIVEYRGISRGIVTLDKMLKRSGVMALYAAPVCVGKYLIAVGGDVGDVREAKDEAESADGVIAGRLITGAHPDILGYFRRARSAERTPPDAVGIFETRNISPGFVSLDAALKSGQTGILRIWMGHFIGGKFCWVIQGEISEVSSALKSAALTVSPEDVAGSDLIARPDSSTMALFASPAGALDRTAPLNSGGASGGNS
jgi:microcompartment protein CcmL/EutN